CSGSGVLLELILAGRAPAALIFRDSEDVLTLGASIAAEMFGKPIPVLRLNAASFDRLARAAFARIAADTIQAAGLSIPISRPTLSELALSPSDEAMLDGAQGGAAGQAMRIVCAMALQQGAKSLIDVTQCHID